MKSIDRNDFIEVGSIVKVHGTKGEVKTSLTHRYSLKKWAFLEMQGKPVPFYIESVFGGEEDPILKLEGINDPQQASKLTGIVLLKPKVASKTKAVEGADSVEGYMVVDVIFGEIGIVKGLMELPQQLLLQVSYQNKELLIPAVDAIILKVDDTAKQISVKLPDGLLEIT